MSNKNRNSARRSLCKSSSTSNNFEDYDDYATKPKYLCCGRICTKYTLIIFNLLLMIVGGFLVFFGGWTISTKQEYISLFDSSLYQASTYTLISAGCIVVLTGIIGIIGAWLESKKLLYTYLTLLVIIFVMGIASLVLAFAYRATLKQKIKTGLDKLIREEYGQEGFEDKSVLLDELQQRFKCCGSTDFQDFFQSKFVNTSAQNEETLKKYNRVAESCCKSPSKLCAARAHPSNINYRGCMLPLDEYISRHIMLLGVVECSICLIMGLGGLLASLLIRRINRYESVKGNDN